MKLAPSHSLRASCETDLVRKYPLPVVAKWLGNTSMVAMRHYAEVTDEHFRLAAAEGLSETAQNPTQQGAAQRSIARQLPNQPIPQFVSVQRLVTPFCSMCPPKMEAAGIEPASRDISMQASTCVVGLLILAPGAANRQAAPGASREQV